VTFTPTVTFWLRYGLFIDGQINRYVLYPRRLVPVSCQSIFRVWLWFPAPPPPRMSAERNKNRNYVLTHRSTLSTTDCLRNLQSIGVFGIFVGWWEFWGNPQPILQTEEQSVPSLLTRLANIWARLKARYGLRGRRSIFSEQHPTQMTDLPRPLFGN